jgi:hypothetical protein
VQFCCEFKIGVFLLAACEIFNVLEVNLSKMPLHVIFTMPKAMQAMKATKKAKQAGASAPKAMKAVK